MAFYLLNDEYREYIQGLKGIPFVLDVWEKNINQTINQMKQSTTRRQLQELGCSLHPISIKCNMRLNILAKSSLCFELVRRLMNIKKTIHRFTLKHITYVLLRIKNYFLKQYIAQLIPFEKAIHMYNNQSYREAVNLLACAACFNHGKSHALLATILIEGRPNVPKNENDAFEIASAGEKLNCPHSKGVFGYCILLKAISVNPKGRWQRSSKEYQIIKGFNLGRDSSQSDSCYGHFVVGWCFHHGYHVSTDYKRALEFYHRAAAQGVAAAQFNLYLLYNFGEGVTQDKLEARRWWQLAAAHGYYR